MRGDSEKEIGGSRAFGRGCRSRFAPGGAVLRYEAGWRLADKHPARLFEAVMAFLAETLQEKTLGLRLLSHL